MADYYQDDLIGDVERKLNVSRAFAKAICRAVLSSLREAILRDDRTHFNGIGTIQTVHVHRHETNLPPGKRTEAVPRPGGRCVVPAYRRLAFRRADGMHRDLRLPHAER